MTLIVSRRFFPFVIYSANVKMDSLPPENQWKLGALAPNKRRYPASSPRSCSVSSFFSGDPLPVRHLRDKSTSSAAKCIKMKHAFSFGLQAAPSHFGFALNPDGESAFPNVGRVPTLKLTTTEGARWRFLIVCHVSSIERSA